MKRSIILAAMLPLALGACSTADSAFTGSPHGYAGQADGLLTGIRGVPSILQPGEAPLHSEYTAAGDAKDMPSTYTVDIAGNLSATGVAATLLAEARVCQVAPASARCGAAGQ